MRNVGGLLNFSGRVFSQDMCNLKKGKKKKKKIVQKKKKDCAKKKDCVSGAVNN